MLLKRTLIPLGLIIFSLLSLPERGVSQSLQSVSNFGTDPGNLRMYEYEPSPQPQGNAPLVVVLHGCGQTASGYFNSTEWHRLADRYGFYLVFPEQKSSNNSYYCFNWFLPGDQERGSGEAKSIRQMVDKMKTDHSIDGNAVYVTGLSAGGGMTSVMMACYPDIFRGGAVMAGLPYKAASSLSRANKAMNGKVDSTPSEWETIAKGGYPSFSGVYPTLATFHGSSDGTVDPINARELMEQWTALHGTDQNVDHTETAFAGASSVKLEEYRNGNDSIAVARYTIDGMGHGISVNPGSPVCKGKGGNTGSAAFDEGFFSSFWAARFFGIIPFAEIRGPASVSAGEQGVVFSTPYVEGSSWSWKVPSGASIVSGQGTDSIEVDWGSQPGYVKVTRTDSNGCEGISDSIAVGLTSIEDDQGMPREFHLIGPNPSDRGFRVHLDAESKRAVRLELYDANGKKCTLPQKYLAPGERLHFGAELTPGLYLLRAGGGSHTLIVR